MHRRGTVTGYSVVIDESDNCDATPTVAFVSDVNNGGAGCAGDPYIVTRTYSVTDDCGNTINVTQTITAIDNTNPTASNPAPINVQCIAGVPLPDISVVIDESDNCDATPTVAFVSDVNNGGAGCAGDPYIVTRTYSVTDDCGNTINVTQTITAIDNTNPTASNPAPINVQCIAGVPLPDISVVIDESDNCDATPTVAFVSDVNNGGAGCAGDPYIVTRTYSVTDDCGNTINVTQTITAIDNTNPTASNPAPINVQCIAGVPLPDISVVIDESDNCDATPTVAFVSDVNNGGAGCAGDPYIVTRTYSVTDDCGNTINVTQTITAIDNTNPTASNPAPINVQCIAGVPLPDISVVIDESDNCDATPTVAFVSDVNNGGAGCAGDPYIVTRTYSVTDDCGNTINVTQTITAIDNTNPTASNPAPINVQCIAGVPLPDISVVIDESDNCDATPTVAFVSDVNNGGAGCAGDPYIVTRTYSVTDDCGNTINVTQTITAIDNTNPTASNPAPINVQCIAGVPLPDISVVIDESDNCDATPTVAFVSDVNNGGAGCAGDPYIVTRTYSVTDDCGNTINVTQTITAIDNTNPTASNPAPINVQCIAGVPLPDISVVIDESDNCDATPTVAFVSDVNNGGAGCAGDPYIVTRTYSVTDDCGNTINVTQTITAIDNTNPTASNPAPINVQCIAGVPLPDISVVIDESDNCDATPTVAFVSDVNNGGAGCAGDPYIVTRTYSVTDDCGNTINVTQTITAIDNTNPTASNPAPINVQCIAGVPLPDISVVIDESDNCDATPTVAFVSDVNNGGAGCAGDPYIVTRTYSVTDDCGNTINVTQTITAIDNTNPTASNPAPINVQCIAGVPLPDISVVIDESDNCDATPTVAFVSDVNNGGAGCAGDPYIVTRTYSVTDDCGNTINVTQTITAIDNTNPTASNPAPINVQCIAGVPLPDISVVIDESDNCDATPTVAFVSDVNNGGAGCAGDPYIVTRTYSVTDDCGNTINVTQTITAIDNTNPTASNPAPINVQCIAGVPLPDISVVIDESDNCDATPTVAFVSDVNNGGAGCAGDPYIVTRTYSVTDDCGNTINVTQTITAIDNTNPTASNPAPINVQCIAGVPLPDISVVIDESDNCDATPTVAFVSDVNNGGAGCAGDPYIVTRTYSVTDDCGNTINVTQTITAIDNTNPTASNPAPINVQCIAGVPLPDISVVIDESDNCDATPTVAFVSDVNNGGAGCAGDPYIVTRTYSVTDDCGNTINVTQTITAIDNTNPTASNPAPINVQCIAGVPLPDISVVIDESDNCDATPTVAFVSDVNNGGAGCAGDPYIVTRTYSVTDDCGNTINVTQTITAIDNTNPTASNPAPINVQCIAGVPLPDISVVIDESDNCDATPTVAFVSDVNNGGAGCAGDPYIVTRTYSVTDDCGNTINVTQTITAIDNTNPTASNPAPINVQCIAGVPLPDISVVIDESDNCDATPTVAFVSDVNNGGAGCAGDPYIVTRTYSVTDDCGNTINVTQTITAIDNTNPTASNPAPINVQCIAGVPLPDISVVIDESDNCDATPTVAFVSDVNNGGAGCAGDPYIVTRTYSVTDDCGNTINVTQTITAIDNTNPTASNPAPINVQCIAGVPLPDISVVIDESDNCDATPTVAFVSDVNNGGAGCAGDPYIVTRTYSVTDDCGNTINVTQTITAIDNTNPTASNPAPINVQCIAGVPLPDISVVIDESDNCDATPTVAFVSDVNNGGAGCAGDPYIVTRTYSVTDDCGNTINVTQTITAIDNTNPTASNPAPINVQCIAGVPLPDISVVIDESDNCDATPTVAFVSDVNNGGAGCAGDPYIVTRTYSVTDDCGNTINVTQTITAIDNTNPTASNPAPINVQCIAGVPLPDISVVIDESDNCDATPTVAFVSDVNNGGAGCAGDPYIVTRTYSVTDDCGNTINVTQTITAIDNTNPTASNPAPINVQCIAGVPLPDISVVIDESDNCDATPTVAFVSDVNNGGAGCAGDPYIVTRTYSVTDDCGNTINVTQTITAIDNTNPTASNPAPINVQCIAGVPLPDISVVIDESDNCDATPTVAFVSDVNNGGAGCAGDPYIVTRTYSVTDDCGNTINVTQTITAIDNTNPTASNPAPINVQCIAGVPLPDISVVIDESDNCDATPTVAFVSDVNNGGAGCAGDPYIVTRTYSVTDDCGNTINVTQTITAIDNTNPTASNPAPINVQCIAGVPLPDISVVIDESDNCDATPTVAFVSDVNNGGAGCAGDPYIVTRTYSVTDDCGNTINVTQTITAIDNTNPTASNPAPINVQCIAGVPLPDISVVIDESDNCDATPTVAFVSDVNNGGAGCAGDPYIVTRTYSVTDDCGNTINVTQTITAIDNTDPTFTVPANDTICRNLDCTYDIDPAITGDVTDESDNCSVAINATYLDNFANLTSCDTAGYIIRKWKLTDACGNYAEADQLIWVEPVALVTLSPKRDTICNGDAVSITLNSLTISTHPVRFRYITEAPAGVTVNPFSGGQLANNAVLTNTITNINNSAQLVKFIITPYSRNASGEGEKCTGINDTAYVWVEPTITLIATNDTICNGGTTDIPVTSSNTTTNGIRYTWTVVDNPAITGETGSAGSGQIIGSVLAQTLTNNSSDAQKVTYTITPWTVNERGNNACPGTPMNTDVWVEPTVTITATNDTICSGGTTDIPVTSSNTTTNGIRYTWTVVDNPAITGETGSTGSGQIIGSVLAQTLTNNSNDAQKVTYTITPWTVNERGNNACPGTPMNTDVWVEPTVTITATNDTICSGGTTDIPVTSSNTTTNGIRYTWTVVDNPAITGETGSAGSGQIIGSVLAQTLTNNSNDVQKVTYTITPWTVNEHGNNACPGTPMNTDVWVEPTITLIATNDTICNGGTTDIPVTSSNTTTNGIRYTWTVVDNPAITGETGSAGSGQIIGSVLAQTLTNNSSDAQKVTYTITPWTVNEHGNNACPGTPMNTDVWIEPTVTITATNDTICSGGTTDIPVTSSNTTTNGIRYTWTVVDNPAITGETGSTGSGQIIGSVLAQTLTNNSNDAQKVTYTITPWTVNERGNNACPGTPINIDVWVEPVLKIYLTPASDTLCDGDITQLIISSPTLPTHPVRFRYIILPDNPGSLIYNGLIVTGLFTNDTIAEAFVNKTDFAQRLRIEVTPYTLNGNGMERCTGSPANSIFWIEPTPKVTLSTRQDTICTSLRPTVGLTTVTHSLQPVRFYYEAVYNPTNISVYFVQDTFNLSPGFTIADSLVNHTSVPQEVTFIIYPYLQGTGGIRKCSGIPDTSHIWVAPTLNVVVDTISTYIGGRNIRCFNEKNGSIRLMPVGGITAFPNYDVFDLQYVWSNGDTSNYITGLGAGNYSVTITDKLQCRDNDAYVLTQPARLRSTVKVINELSCHGADGIIAPVTTGGTSPYRYCWNVPPDYVLPSQVCQDTLYQVMEGHYTVFVKDTNDCETTRYFPLSQPQPVYVQAVSDTFGNFQIKCYGENTGSWTSVNNGRSNITYHWTGPNGFDTTFTNSQRFNYQDSLYAGRYRLQYTDSAGCTGTFIRDMNQPNPLIIDRATVSTFHDRYNVSCFGSQNGSIMLNSIKGGHEGRGYWFDWTSLTGSIISDNSLRNQTSLGAGSYSVVVSDTFNCMTSDTFELVQPDELVVQAELPESLSGGHNLNCFGDTTGYIILHPQGGDTEDGPYQFLWQQGGTSSEQHNLQAGNYIVTVTDGIQCSITDTFSLTQPDQLKLDSVVFSDYNGYDVSCSSGDDGTIQIFASGGIGSFEYSWTDEGGTLAADSSFIDQLRTGQFMVTITDANNCATTQTFTLEAPPPLIIQMETANVNCTGAKLGNAQANVTGGLPSYAYSWSSGETTPEISDLDTGLYILMVTDKNLCQVTDTAVIGQNSTVLIDIQVIDSISCHLGSDGILFAAVSEGIPPYSYLWNNGTQTDTISGVQRGSYMLTVSDQEGCTNSQTIDIDDPDPITATISVTDATCFGFNDGSVVLGASGGTGIYSYFWNNTPVNGSEVDVISAGTYTLQILDAENCQIDTLVMVSEPELLVLTLDEQLTVYPFCPDWENGALAVRITGGTPEYQYQWAGYPDDMDSVLNEVKEDYYTVSVIDRQGCAVDTTLRLIAQNNTCLGIPTAFTPNYDNANDYWDISYINENGGEAPFHEVYPNGAIQVYDRLGNLVYQCTSGCHQPWNGEDLKGRSMPPDSYYFIIELNDEEEQPPIKGIVTIIK